MLSITSGADGLGVVDGDTVRVTDELNDTDGVTDLDTLTDAPEDKDTVGDGVMDSDVDGLMLTDGLVDGSTRVKRTASTPTVPPAPVFFTWTYSDPSPLNTNVPRSTNTVLPPDC